MASLAVLSKRVLVGRPLSSNQLKHRLLPKRLALPVFCSDPLSSNAYATEEILLGLSLGGLALIHLAPWGALAVIVLLAVVVTSYRHSNGQDAGDGRDTGSARRAGAGSR